jgi:hypothetical protein
VPWCSDLLTLEVAPTSGETDMDARLCSILVILLLPMDPEEVSRRQGSASESDIDTQYQEPVVVKEGNWLLR